MADKSGIAWTESTWNPLTGCKAVSPGCDNCYAAREASGRLRNVPAYEGLAENGVFTGEVRLLPDRLDQPRRWKKGRRIFVNSMSDLFHHDVPIEFQAAVFREMEACPQHQFQVLTKRPEIMARRVRAIYDGAVPSANIWLGTTIESQEYARRADFLRQTPARVRFISAEPLIAPLPFLNLTDIDWLIVGGESGPNARKMEVLWAVSLREQAEAYGTAFFMKQLGEKLGAVFGSTTRAGHDIESFPEILQVQEYPQ